MSKPQAMKHWLDVSKSLQQSLLPEGSGVEMFGYDLTPVAFATLIDSEYTNVDETFAAMAVAVDKQAVKDIYGLLSTDTSIALFSRWAQYTSHWELHPNPQHWFPSDPINMWRAVLMSMTKDKSWTKATAKPLLSKWFTELQ